MTPCILLLSGGLDSATLLAIAQAEGFAPRCLSFDYGQRHRHELDAARAVAAARGIPPHHHLTVPLDLRAFGGSALTDDGLAVPKDRAAGEMERGIPITYVPARNLVFLSLAAGLAEVVGARDLFIGVNAVDYSGYPDCRPEFIESFQRTVNLATRAGVEDPNPAHGGAHFRLHTPLIGLTKADIIRRGISLGVNYSLTHSCYDPVPTPRGPRACGGCDSCQIRAAGFRASGVPDPTLYA